MTTQIAFPARAARRPGAPGVDVRPTALAARGADGPGVDERDWLLSGVLVREGLDDRRDGDFAV